MKRKTMSLALVLLFLAALPVAAEVKVGYDETVDFSGYQTYSWRQGTPAARPEIQEWIVAAVDGEMQTAGLHKVKEGADIEVTTVAFGEWKNALVGNYVRLGSNSTWGIITADVAHVATGNLIVELAHQNTETVVWRAIAKDAVDDSKPKKIRSKVDKLVKKMFKDFPPQ